MKIRTSYLIPLILFAILTIAFFPARKYYLFLKEPTARLSDAIPPETALMLKASSLNRLLDILKSSPLLEQSESMYYQINIDSISDKLTTIIQKNSFFGEMADQHEVVLCVVPDSGHRPRLLLLLNTGKLSYTRLRKQVSGLLKPGEQLVEDKTLPLKAFSLISGETRVWIYAYQGLMAVAFSKETLRASAGTLRSDQHLSDDPGFKKLSETSGKKVDGILMINSVNMAGCLLQAGDNNPLKFSGSPFDGWMSLDLHISEDKILMDGFTYGKASPSILDSQEPVDATFAGYLPAATALAVMVSVSNPQHYSAFFYDPDTLHCMGYDSANQCFSKEIFRRNEQLNAWMGNTLCFAAFPSYFSGNTQSCITLIELKSADSARMMLKPFIRPFEQGIGQIADNRLFRNLWGGIFAQGSEQYCIFHGKVLAVSPDPAILRSYMADEQQFAQSELYKRAHAVISDKSNLLILAKGNIWSRIFGKGNEMADPAKAREWLWPMSNTSLAGIQMSAGGRMLFTHAFVLTDKKGIVPDNLSPAEIPAERDSVLPSPPEKKPEVKAGESPVSGSAASRLMTPALSGKISRMVFALKGNVVETYSAGGEKLWAYTLKEDTPAAIFEAGRKGSSEKYYLIAGTRSVVLVDNDGREVKNSAAKLPSNVKGAMALFDYDRTKDYRIIFRGSDQKIYLIGLDGKVLPDWTYPVSENALAGPPEFIRTAGKDFILFSDSKGKLSITDRRGRKRIEVAVGFRKSVKSGIFENRSNSKGLFLMASAEGELAYINSEGVISLSKFGDHGKDPWFTYLDFNGDGSEDFIFSGKGKLTVYNKMKKVLLNLDLSKGSFSDPAVYTTAKTSWIALRNRNTGEIMLVNRNNQGYGGSNKLSSETDPVFIFDEKKKRPVLVTQKQGMPEFTVL